MGKKNRKGLTLEPPKPKPAAPSAGDAQIPGAIGNSEDRRDTLEIGVEFKLDLKNEDLIVIKELGAGNGGTVSKVQHAATKDIMARKVRHISALLAPFSFANIEHRSYMLKRSEKYDGVLSKSWASCMSAARHTSFPSTAPL